jgi:EthD domain-containing protein
MEKLCYLLFRDAEVPGSDLRRALVEKAVPALRGAGAREITLHVQDEDVAAGTPLRRSDPPIRAMVSFWLHDADDRGPCEAALAPHAARLAGYVVLESRPLVHEMPKGRRTPGMNQVTCVARKPGLDYDEFIRIWHGDHRAVAIETQSTTGYVRNEIIRKLTPGAPDWAAIVEETFPIGALTDPKVFYDAKDDADLRDRMGRMMASCQRFLDFEPMEYTLTSEYYLG